MIDGSAVAASPDEGPDHWKRLHEDLTAGDVSQLDPDELELLAQAAFWLGCPRETITARGLAYGLHRGAEDHARAARMCWQPFHNPFELDETAAVSGWLSRARRTRPRGARLRRGRLRGDCGWLVPGCVSAAPL